MGNQDMMKDLLTEGMKIADDLYFHKGALSDGRLPDKRDKIMDQINTMIEAFAKRTTLKLDVAKVVESIDKNKTCAVFDIGRLLFVREDKKPQVFTNIDMALEFVSEKGINAIVIGIPEGYDFGKIESDLSTLRKTLREQGDEDVAPLEDEEPAPEAPPADDKPGDEEPPVDDDKAPKKKEPADKEYFGRKGDQYFYLLRKKNDAGDIEDLIVADVDGNEVMSAKAMEKDVSDDIGFLIDAIKDADMDEISHDIYVAYIYPKIAELMMEPEAGEEELPAGGEVNPPVVPPPAGGPPASIESKDFVVGYDVQTIEEYESVPKGAVGKVVEVKDGKAKIKFTVEDKDIEVEAEVSTIDKEKRLAKAPEGKVPDPTDTIPKQIADMLEEVLGSVYSGFGIRETDDEKMSLKDRIIKRTCEALKGSKEVRESLAGSISKAFEADENIEALDIVFEADGAGNVNLAYIGEPGKYKATEGMLTSCYNYKRKKKAKK